MNAQKHIAHRIILGIVLFIPILNNCYQIENEAAPDDKLIWTEGFDSPDLPGWKVIDEIDYGASNWFVEKGFLIQDTDFGSTRALSGTNIIKTDKVFDDCVIRANLVCTDDDFIGLLFRYQDIDNYYRFLLSSQRKVISVDKKVNGEFETLAVFDDEEWQHVKFSVTIFTNGDSIKVYLNDKLFFNIQDESFTKGKLGFTSISNLGSFFDDISVYSVYSIHPPEKKQSIVRGPYLQNVLENHAVIMWDTELPANSIVEYGLSKENTRLVKIEENAVKHEVKLTDLNQAASYYYRIHSGNVTSDWHTFKSVSDTTNAFKFIAYGDTQMGFLRHAEIADQIIRHDFDFIVHMGDVVQRGPRSDWDLEFFDPMKKIFTDKPVYAAIGNHELNSDNYYKNFSNPAAEHESYYSFRYGNSFFVVIDNAKAYRPERKYFTEYEKGSEQYKWLESELASENAQSAEWLFVVSHVPGYVGSKPDLFPGCKESLVPLFEKYNVDISFSGHVHGYGRAEQNGVTYIITAGGGGAQNKKGSEEKLEYAGFQLTYNFSQINIDGKKLLIKTYNNKGELIDETEMYH